MRVATSSEPIVRRASDDIEAPWLTGPHPRWVLCEPVIYYLDDVQITVPEGYVFNGSSIPRALWWLYPPSFAPAWRGSLIHDRGYSHEYKYYSKESFDRALAAFILADGGRTKDARRFFWATSTFGRGGWNWK